MSDISGLPTQTLHQQQPSILKKHLPDWLVWVILGVILLILGASWFYFLTTMKTVEENNAKAQDVINKTLDEEESDSSNEAKETPAPTQPPQQVDNTANWKLYTDSKYGFSVKYPNQVYGRIVCPDDETDKFMLESVVALNGKDPLVAPTCGRDSFYPLELTPEVDSLTSPVVNTDLYDISQKTVVVDGISAEQYIVSQKISAPGPSWYIILHVPIKGSFYKVVYTGKCDSDLSIPKSTCEAEFDDIISTLKFD